MRLQTYELTGLQRQALEDSFTEHAPGQWVVVHRLTGDLDVARLGQAILSLKTRTSIFGRSYVRSGGSWAMVVGDEVDPPLDLFDLRGHPEDAAFDFIAGLRQRGLRPESAPLARFTLLELDHGWALVFTAAPWLIDRFSLAALYQALSAAYRQDGHASGGIDLDQQELLALEADFATSPAAGQARRYWLALLRERRTQLSPPRWIDPLSQTTWITPVDDHRLAQLVPLADDFGIPLAELLLMGVHLFLAKMTDSQSIVTRLAQRTGDPTPDGQTRPIGYAESAGYFLSLPHPDLRVRDYLLDTARLHEQSRRHSQLADQQLLAQMRRVEPGFTSFTNVSVVADTLPHGALQLPGVQVTLLPRASVRTPPTDLSIAMGGGPRPSLTVTVRDPHLMPGVQQMLPALTHRLEHLGAELDTTIGALSWTSEQQRSALLRLAHRTAPASQPATLLARILAHAQTHPEAVAVRYEGRELTYRALMAAADSVAAQLRPCLAQAGPDPLVGICLPRGLEMIVALVGVMRAGAGYVPLDPGNPPERLAYILDDARAAAVIVDEDTVERVVHAGDVPRIALPAAGQEQALQEAPPPAPEDRAATAYVIYTSGTTGLPKGVVVERGNLAAYLAATEDVCACGPGQRWLQFASINFDASVLEIGNCLARGATLVVAPAQVRADPEAIADLLAGEEITHAFIPPAMLRSLPRRDLPSLTDIYVGGEASDDLTVAYWSRAVRLWNCYGPTETTVMCSAKLMGDQRSAADLGGPLPGYSMYVLDEDMQLVPPGGMGEIWIGGDAVTRGYLGREHLTAQRFRDNPFGPGRLYRTGDLARHFPNGDLEYLGRNDFQVKIRGFRIELGDIEAAITGMADVTGVYVSVIDGPGGKSLGAWYTTNGQGPEPDAVARAIGQRLPHYMVPSHLVRLAQFPVNISGKVDRTRLPMPTTDSPGPTGSLTPLEAAVRAVWAEVLAVPAATLGPDSHFFHLGGHSLAAAVTCHQVTERTGLTATARMLFEHPILAQFCSEIGQDATALPTPAVRAAGTQSATIAGAMPAMMFRRAAQIGSDTAYTIVMRVDVGPQVNPLQFRRAVRELLAGDAVFRSAFTEVSGRVRLTVDPQAAVDVPLTADADIPELVEQFRTTAFDLQRAPLWRAEVVAGEAGTTLLFAVHHGIFDGWSLNLMLAEIAARYDALRDGPQFQRSAPTMLDYGRYLEGHDELRQRAISYWDAKLRGASCRIELPTATGRSRPDANRELMITIPARTVADLKALATRLDVTLPPVLFAGYLVWLWRVTGQRELVVAYPYAGRDVPGADGIYGMFVQMGFLRTTIDPEESFAALVARVGQQMVADREHLIASPYDVDLTASGSPNVLFSLQSGIGLEATYGSVTFTAHEYASRSSKADIAGILYASADGGLQGRMEYDSSALDAATITGLVESWEWMVPQLPEAGDAPLSELPYLPPAQRAHLAAVTVGPEVPDGPNTLVGALRAAATEHPQAVAIHSTERTLTYAQMDRTTDLMAAALRATFPLRRQQLIGLSGRKSAELVLAAIAILKAGCAYVPLDPHYPVERLGYILADADVQVVVADPEAAQILRGTGREGLHFFDPYADVAQAPTGAAVPGDPDPRDLAYVIYTSGSTGRPKGVMVEHATVPAMIRGSAQLLAFDDSCRMLLLGTLNFDASVLQVFLPLLTGGALVIPAANAEQDPQGLHTFVDEQRVTHIVATPSLIRNLPHKGLPHLRLLGFGGEAIDSPTAGYWSEQTSFWSLYGPTETTVMCSAGQILPGANSRTIGKPLPGYSMTLRDDLLQPVLVGAAGEIVIGGGGAARGYLGRPDLTLDRFLVDPDGTDPLGIVYRSGDLGRLLPDGSIEYLGRNDDQVKLRGFRIELGEVEAAMQSAPGVTQAAALVRGEGDLRMIVGYLTGPPDLDLEAVRAHCASVLPEYMVPSKLVRLDQLPLNANGKLDRRALPDVTFISTSPAPHAGRETEIAAVWEELLHLPGIGRDDDFFRLGGNSLLAARLQALLRERVGLDLSTAAIYAAPTIAGLAGQGEDDAIAQAVRTAVAGVGMPIPKTPQVPAADPPTVLLTGATGFLGTFLLAELVARSPRVIALVRGTDQATARAGLAAQVARAGLAVDLDRVQVELGDLAVADLGLPAEVLARLADEVDVVVHNGAWVHHRYSYPTMRASNVDSTAALLRLALSGCRQARFTYVSTQSAAEAVAGIDRVAEAVLDPVAFPPASDNGYLLTKWVAEELVADASRNHNLAALIARPGNITGQSSSGFSNYAHNHFWLFTKACLQLGTVPTLPDPVELTPVDVLARAIVGLALDEEAGLRVTNLSNPIQTDWPQWLSLVGAQLGRPVTAVAPAQWQDQLLAAGEDNALWSLRELYAGDLNGNPLPVERDQTQQRLARIGLSTAADPAALAPTYVQYLQREGFWPS